MSNINLSGTPPIQSQLEVIGLVPAAVAFDQSCQFGKELPIPQDIPKAKRSVKLGLAFVWLLFTVVPESSRDHKGRNQRSWAKWQCYCGWQTSAKPVRESS